LALQKYVMEVIDSEWITSRKLAERIARKHPEVFKAKPYNGDITALSMALGPVLYALARRGLIEHDGAEWPKIKRWRRIVSKGHISVNEVAKALVNLHYAADENQAIRLLAARAVREHESEFRKLVKQASRLSEESAKIAKKMLGLLE